MYHDENALHLSRIYVQLEIIAHGLTLLPIKVDRREGVRDIESRIHAVKIEMASFEDHIAKTEVLQRDYNTKGWWYRLWNSPIPGLPTSQWSRELSVNKERLRVLERRLREEAG